MVTSEDITKYMAAHGLTQAQLAEAVGVHEATVYRWVTGESSPRGLGAQRLRALIESGAEPSRRGVSPYAKLALDLFDQMSQAEQAEAVAMIERMKEERERKRSRNQ